MSPLADQRAPTAAIGRSESWEIRGLERSQEGPITVQGHKHTAVAVLAGAVATATRLAIGNLPDVEDIRVIRALLADAGAVLAPQRNAELFDLAAMAPPNLLDDRVLSVHGSLYLLPAVVARFGRARFRGAGGCQIGSSRDGGARPIWHVLSVLERFGAEIVHLPSGVIAIAADRLEGCDIDASTYRDLGADEGPFRSGVTKTALICAGAVRGATSIRAPYGKPDALELVGFLRAIGRRVSVGPRRIDVAPTDMPGSAKEVQVRIPPDFSEVMTWIASSVCREQPVHLSGLCESELLPGLSAELELLHEMGVELRWHDGGVTVEPPATVAPVDVHARPDGIYSDHQPLFAAMLLRASGESSITEGVWPERFDYVDGLRAMGADIERRDRAIRIRPVRWLHPPSSPVVGRDVRAVATLVVVASSLRAPVEVLGVEHLRRGYAGLPAKLKAFGVRVS